MLIDVDDEKLKKQKQIKNAKQINTQCHSLFPYLKKILQRETNSHGNLAEPKEACITLSFLHLYYMLHYLTKL